MQENLCLRCKGLSAADRLANRSNSIASRALLSLKRFTYSAVFVKFVRCIRSGSHLESGNMTFFSSLSSEALAFLICLCFA